MSNIVLMIMTSGEHIIGQLLNTHDDGSVEIEMPVSMVPDPNSAKRGNMMFMPYLQFTNSTKCTFPAKDIRHILNDLRDELANAYNGQFGSGIVTPRTGRDTTTSVRNIGIPIRPSTIL